MIYWPVNRGPPAGDHFVFLHCVSVRNFKWDQIWSTQQYHTEFKDGPRLGELHIPASIRGWNAQWAGDLQPRVNCLGAIRTDLVCSRRSQTQEGHKEQDASSLVRKIIPLCFGQFKLLVMGILFEYRYHEILSDVHWRLQNSFKTISGSLDVK